jgi:RNA polymerase sigma factor (sigma-70 family)
MLLYEKMWPFALATNYRLLKGDRSLAEDATQKVFLKLLERGDFEAFKSGEHFKNYLERMCSNMALDLLRAAPRRREVSLNIDLAASVDPLLDRVMYEELMKKLDQDDQTLLRLFLAGHTLVEVADKLQTSISTVARRRRRLWARLEAIEKGDHS